MVYGLTLTGFVIKPYTIIQQELQSDMQNIFGSDLDISSQSIAGQWINQMALKEYQLWEIAQAVYAAWSPDTASGDALDDACARVNIARLVATPSTVIALLYGSIGTIIPIGHLIQQQITGIQFALDVSVTIDQTAVGDLILTIGTVADSTDYTITINGTAYTYHSGSGATAISICTGLISALGTISGLTITAPTTSSIKILSSDGFTPYALVITANLTINTIGIFGAYTATATGSNVIPYETVTIIVNSISGLNSVINMIQGVTGRNIESDDALRIRRRNSLAGQGRATEIAIESHLIQDVAGVTAVTVISNRGDVVDIVGRPPHSFECIVAGGTASDVALGIWNNINR